MAHTIESLIAMAPGAFLPGAAKGVDTVIQLEVTGAQAGKWNAVIKDSKFTITKGVHPSPKLSVSADTADILAVANGQLNPTMALMQGKAKVTGDLTEAIKLLQLFALK